MSTRVDREALARAEMEATQVGRGTALALIAALLAVLATGGIVERLWPLAPDPGVRPVQIAPLAPAALLAKLRAEGPLAVNHELEAFLRRVDEWATKDFALGRHLRRPVQRFLLGRLSFGNAQVRVGRGGWLFYEREIDALTGPPFLDHPSAARRRLGDPEAAIRALGADLRARGIALALVPAPHKASIEIARLLGGPAPDHPIRNPSFAQLVRRLEAAGIPVFDPAPMLFARARGGEPTYLSTDSHWRPAAVDLVAAAIAREIFARGVLAEPVAPRFQRTAQTIVGRPDLVRLLGLPSEGEGPLYPAVEIQVVREPNGELFRPQEAADAPILLLGDSFAGIYSWGDPRLGAAAGLAEQLAFHLQTPVQAILEPAGSQMDSRERLASQLRQRSHLLDGKRLVILELAERELAIGAWRPAPLPPAPVPAGR